MNRLATGIDELDIILGGGLATGSLVILAGGWAALSRVGAAPARTLASGRGSC